MTPLWVTTAAESQQRDAVAITGLVAEGKDSYALMWRAGMAAAEQLCSGVLRGQPTAVAVHCGPGNNGGDGWVVAQQLRAVGHDVRVATRGTARSADAQRAQAEAIAEGAFAAPDGSERVVIDALLGTGAHGALRDSMRDSIAQLRAAAAHGARVIALDLPSGLDATSGDDHGAVPASETLTFGTIKRGLLLRRDLAGAISLLRIGVEEVDVPGDTALPLLDARLVRAAIPPIRFDAHKGTRGRVVIVGGAVGMAGAVVLAARAALRSGAGLVHTVVAGPSVAVLQCAVPAALALVWGEAFPRADALVIGPGLGDAARERVMAALHAAPSTPTVLDADALNAFAGDTAALRAAIGGRPCLITPHVAEAARLLGIETVAVLRDRFTIGRRLVDATGATVVLKGTPTMLHAPDGRTLVAPVGSPVLATGGSGDLLSGILGALLAVGMDPFDAAAAGVWAHGAAAESVATTAVRGHNIDDVEQALREVWQLPNAADVDHVLATLPTVGE